jgi:hypothetical protein
MSVIENELFRVVVRGMRREFELLSRQDRIDELEASQWARLEPVD